MSKLKKIFTNVRVIILVVFLLAMIVAINPSPYREGAAIRTVIKDSAAAYARLESPKPNSNPVSREVIHAINGELVMNEADYHKLIEDFEVNQTVTIETNKGAYRLRVRPETETIELNETEEKTVTEIVEVTEVDEETGEEFVFNETVNETINVTKKETRIIGVEDLGLVVYDAPKSNIRKGLDLEGGTRVLLQPEGEVSPEDMELAITSMGQRLNVFGLSDVIIRQAGDLSGNNYILIEIPGTNEREVKDLLAKQGKFESKIGEDVVFRGGTDITHVCRTADCSGVDPRNPCRPAAADQWFCGFHFSISVTPEAAQRQSDITKKLGVIIRNGEEYLTQNISLYLDDELVDTLLVGGSLRGRSVTEIAISGSGVGATQQEAMKNTLDNMKRLQTILITGSLPVKFNVVKADTISPLLGENFISNVLLLGVLIILSVGIVVLIRYRDWIISTAIMSTMLAEIVLLLGFASLIRWNLDLAGIAGIIVAAGTGVDDQIIITDEIKSGSAQAAVLDWKKRIKNAFFVIMGSYFTVVVSMVPLLFAGAGLLKGFAFTTIVGVSFGVFLTRPVFAKVVEILLK
ncbi:hypothetical protein ACFL0W_02725 [Nanoarchaeota archaeon]